jgi:ATP-dependent exoDNAse (exonuclease V) alpha subunit
MDRGLVTHHATREAEVAAIASDILGAMRAGQRVIAPGRPFQDCLYVNRAVRAGLGFAGSGHEFEFDRGAIEFAAGDRVLFRANNRKLDVRNGDTGTVRAMTQDDAGSTVGRFRQSDHRDFRRWPTAARTRSSAARRG